MAQTISLTWTRNRGRNQWDPPLDVATDQSVESVNVHLFDGGLGTRRGGSSSVTITGVTGPINALFEYVPAQDLTAAELFLVDGSATTKIFRCAGGTSFSSLTLPDNVATRPWEISAITVNGKLFLAYDSTVNRLHVFEPAYSTTAIRRVGLAGGGAAPTVANTGAGAYPATVRYYKVRYAEYRAGVLYREGEASATTTFTPSGAGTAARITAPTTLSEGDTHYIVMASADGALFYDIAAVTLGSNYDDSANPTTYANSDASPEVGARVPFPSVKYLATDGSRLIGFGVNESTAGDSMTPKAGRVYFSPALDSSNTFDDERVSNTTTFKGYLDLARNSGAADRGITPRPINNIFFAFQSNGVYALVPTESGTLPYRRLVLDTQVGALTHQSIVCASDRSGRACAYFLDPAKGPYVVGGADGLRWCGKDVADWWAIVNLEATGQPAWGLWKPDQHQVWFGVATGSSNDPNVILVLDVTELQPDENGDLRGGWTVYQGDITAARSAVLFSTTLAATRSRTKTPYLGISSGSTLLKYDESVHTDAGTQFQAYVTSGAIAVSTTALQVLRSYVVAGASSGTTIRQWFLRNTQDETARYGDVTLTGVGAQATVLKKVEDIALQDAWAVQVQIGDAAAQDAQWHLEQWRGTLQPEGEL